jgi:NitT/TauT family transport system substrate-binding protein
MPHPSQAQRNTAQRAEGQRTTARTGRVRPGVRTLSLGAALVLSAATVSACSGSSDASLPAPDQPNITVGVTNSLGDVPFLMGVANSGTPGAGAFTKAGLSVTVQTFPTEAAEMAALSAGTIQIAYGEYGQFFAASDPLAASNQLKILSAGYDATAGSIMMLVPKGSAAPDYTAIQDGSPGASIAVPSATGPEYLALAAYLNSIGTPISSTIGMGGSGEQNSDVKIIADPTVEITAAVTHQVSAIVLQEPYATLAQEQDGLVPEVDLASGDSTAVPLDGYFASSTFIQKYPTTAEDFTAVMTKLQALGTSRTVIEAAILSAQTTPSTAYADTIATMQLGTYPTTTIPAKISIVGQLMDDAGTISSPLDITGIVNSDS